MIMIPNIGKLLGDIAGSLPDHHNKAGISIKQVIILVLVESLVFNL